MMSSVDEQLVNNGTSNLHEPHGYSVRIETEG